jgi:hypothetical protein
MYGPVAVPFAYGAELKMPWISLPLRARLKIFTFDLLLFFLQYEF